MIKSEFLEELREDVRTEARAEGKKEGKAEGKAEGQMVALHNTVLRLGRQRFTKAPSRQQKAQLKGITDLGRLKRVCDRLLEASSWTDLLDTP